MVVNTFVFKSIKFLPPYWKATAGGFEDLLFLCSLWRQYSNFLTSDLLQIKRDITRATTSKTPSFSIISENKSGTSVACLVVYRPLLHTHLLLPWCVRGVNLRLFDSFDSIWHHMSTAWVQTSFWMGDLQAGCDVICGNDEWAFVILPSTNHPLLTSLNLVQINFKQIC